MIISKHVSFVVLALGFSVGCGLDQSEENCPDPKPEQVTVSVPAPEAGAAAVAAEETAEETAEEVAVPPAQQEDAPVEEPPVSAPPQQEPPAAEPPSEEPPAEEPPVVDDCAEGCESSPELELPGNTDVVRHGADGWAVAFSTYYVGGDCIEVRGEIPGGDWTTGFSACDDDGDGYVEYSAPAGTVGTFRFTYVNGENESVWADYGTTSKRPYLVCNSEESLKFVGCPWYDAEDGSNNGSDAACDLFITYDGTWSWGAGNMGNYHQFN